MIAEISTFKQTDSRAGLIRLVMLFDNLYTILSKVCLLVSSPFVPYLSTKLVYSF